MKSALQWLLAIAAVILVAILFTFGVVKALATWGLGQ